MWFSSVVPDGECLCSRIQFSSGSVTSQSMITLIEVFNILQTGQVDVPFLDVMGTRLIQPIVENCQQTVFDCLVFLFLCLDLLGEITVCSGQTCRHDAEKPLRPVFDDNSSIVYSLRFLLTSPT